MPNYMSIDRTLNTMPGAFQPHFHTMPAHRTGKQVSFERAVQKQKLFQKDQSKGDMYIGLLLKGIIPDNTTN